MRLDEKVMNIEKNIGIQKVLCDKDNCTLKIEMQRRYAWMKCQDNVTWRYNNLCDVKMDVYLTEGGTCINRKVYK